MARTYPIPACPRAGRVVAEIEGRDNGFGIFNPKNAVRCPRPSRQPPASSGTRASAVFLRSPKGVSKDTAVTRPPPNIPTTGTRISPSSHNTFRVFMMSRLRRNITLPRYSVFKERPEKMGTVNGVTVGVLKNPVFLWFL